MEILWILVAGVLGTLVLTGIMSVSHTSRVVNTDMVRTLGSIATRKYEGSYLPGLILQFLGGMAFSLIYALLIAFSPIGSGGVVVALGALFGLVHGVVLGSLLTVEVAEHHPLARFRKTGHELIISQVVGHIGYGITIGTVFAVTRLDFNHLLSVLEGGPWSSLPYFVGDFLGIVLLCVILYWIPLVFMGYAVFRGIRTKTAHHGPADIHAPHGPVLKLRHK